jgi:hypothetical protein
MPWDNTKATEDGDGTVDSDEQLSADEWNQHVTDGHFPADEVNFDVDGNGDPVVTDPQNADEVIARYDRSEGAWVFTAVSTEEVNNVLIAEPNELQAKIDEMASRQSVGVGRNTGKGTVFVSGNEVIDPSQTIIVKEGVVLNIRSAEVDLTSDINAFELRHGSELHFSRITGPDPYSSKAIRLSTANSGGMYALGDSTNVRVSGDMIGSQTDGIAIGLDDDGGNGIGPGNIFDVNVYGFDRGVVADTGGGFINGPEMRGHFSGCTTGVYDHLGTGQGRVRFYSNIQVTGTTGQFVARNQTDRDSADFIGQIYDIDLNKSQRLFVGPHLTLTTSHSGAKNGTLEEAGEANGNGDDAGQFAMSLLRPNGAGGVTFYDLTNTRRKEMRFFEGSIQHFHVNDGNSGAGLREDETGTINVFETGNSGDPSVSMGTNGAGFYIDTNGDIVAVDEAGNETVIS